MTYPIGDRELGIARVVAHRFSKNRPRLADEIESAAMYGLAKAANTYDPEIAEFSTWAFRLVTHECIVAIKNEKLRGFRYREQDSPKVVSLDYKEDDADGSLIDTVADGDDPVGWQVEQDEEFARLAGLLDERQARIFHARHRLGRKLKEIGDREGVGRARIGQILEQCYERFAKHYGTPDGIPVSTLTASAEAKPIVAAHTPAPDPSRHGQTGESKVDRYGWTIVDRPGKPQMIAKTDLTVDPSYQREESEPKILAISAQWSWMACGVILVARRGQTYFVYDGNHRVMAARRRTDISTLPCLVFETADATEEARAFIRVNTQRKPMTAIDKFRALVMTGDPAALAADELVQQSGRVMTSTAGNQNHVKCAGLLLDCAAKDVSTLRAVWPLVLEISREHPIYERVLAPIFFLERNLKNTPQSLLKDPWKSRITDLGVPGILEAAHKAAAFYTAGGIKVWARGLLHAINKSLRANKLIVPGLEAGSNDGVKP